MSLLGFLPSLGYSVLNKIPVSVFVGVKGDFTISKRTACVQHTHDLSLRSLLISVDSH